MPELAAITLVRNEERFIGTVLEAALVALGAVVVGDTGSTDGTPDVLAALKETFGERLQIIYLGELDRAALGLARGELARVAQGYFGVDYGIIMDGDELYNCETLCFLANYGIPQGKATGFTTLVNIDEDERGALWELDNIFHRHAVFPVASRWRGDYPFESPEIYDHPDLFFHFPLPPGYLYHGLHLHRLVRSQHDARVYMRIEKQHQFCLMPLTIPRRCQLETERWLEKCA